MSSFIVSQRCMNNIINGLFWTHSFKNAYGSLYKEQNLIESKDFEAFANKLWKLNQAAVTQRYSKSDNSEYAKIDEFVWDNDSTPSKLQFLKSLDCLHYQCSEGTVPKRKLYKWLERVIRCLSNHIISSMPEYNKAEWD